MLKMLKQRLGKICLRKGLPRIFIEEKKLADIGLSEGKRYETEVDIENNKIIFKPSDKGLNIVSKKIKKENEAIPVIDKCGSDIRKSLENCSNITISFYSDSEGKGMVLIQGIKNTKEVKKDIENKEGKKDTPLTCITFCAGTGITSQCEKIAGFKEVAACEYNPKSGAEDKFAKIYEKNHPESIMFNIPMELLKAEDLPYADLWFASLDCSDYSKLASSKTEFKTMHLFIHLMRLFYQKSKKERPIAIAIENVPGFMSIAGNSLKLCLEENGYHVSMQILDSLDFGARTQRKRFFFVASIYEGFEFPKPTTGRKETPIEEDGVITVNSLDWVTPLQNGTLKNLVEREKKGISHNHKMRTFDITTDSHIGTIIKSHCNYVPENIIRHPYKENMFAFLMNPYHLKYLHGIWENFYLGDSRTTQIQAIGQGVCVQVFQPLMNKLYEFLKKMTFKEENINKKANSIYTYQQLNLLDFI